MYNGGDDCATYLKEWKENETKHFETLMNAQLWKEIDGKLENKNEGINWDFSGYFFTLPGEDEQGYIEKIDDGEVISLEYDVSGQVNVILQPKNAAIEEQIWQRVPANDGYFRLKNEKTQAFLTTSAAATLITGSCL